MLPTALAPSLPANQASRTAAVLSTHGIVTGLPVSSTTIVCGFAAATAEMIASWLCGNERSFESIPSLAHLYAKTMATSAPFAVAAAAAGSVPASYLTVARGARVWIAFSGEVGNQIS